MPSTSLLLSVATPPLIKLETLSPASPALARPSGIDDRPLPVGVVICGVAFAVTVSTHGDSPVTSFTVP